MSTQIAVAAAVAGLGVYAFYLRGGSSDSTKPVLGSFGFHSLKVHSAELVNHNTKKLRLELPNKDIPSGLSLSSALLTLSRPEGRWLPVLRPYTPTNDLSEPGFVELHVKHYPNGKASTHLHSLQPGDYLTVAPIPSFPWKANKHPHLAMIAGGAGITPMYQLARGILADPADRTRITLVWGVNADEDIFLGPQLAELEAQHPGRFKAVYVVSHPDAGSKHHHRGYVTRQVLEQAGLAADKNRDAKVLVCGPPAMEKALKGGKWGAAKGGVLAELGYGGDQVYSF